jgi:hypothetical protein
MLFYIFYSKPLFFEMEHLTWFPNPEATEFIPRVSVSSPAPSTKRKYSKRRRPQKGRPTTQPVAPRKPTVFPQDIKEFSPLSPYAIKGVFTPQSNQELQELISQSNCGTIIHLNGKWMTFNEPSEDEEEFWFGVASC